MRELKIRKGKGWGPMYVALKGRVVETETQRKRVEESRTLLMNVIQREKGLRKKR